MTRICQRSWLAVQVMLAVAVTPLVVAAPGYFALELTGVRPAWCYIFLGLAVGSPVTLNYDELR